MSQIDNLLSEYMADICFGNLYGDFVYVIDFLTMTLSDYQLPGKSIQIYKKGTMSSFSAEEYMLYTRSLIAVQEPAENFKSSCMIDQISGQGQG